MYFAVFGLLCGGRPTIFIQTDSAGKIGVTSRFNMPEIMRDLNMNAAGRMKQLIDEIEERWKRSDLKDRFRLTLEDAKRV
jgi:hypothetical protein